MRTPSLRRRLQRFAEMLARERPSRPRRDRPTPGPGSSQSALRAGRPRLAIVAGALLLLLGPAALTPASAARARNSLAVHLQISGPYRASGTLETTIRSAAYACMKANDYVRHGGTEYAVDYNVPALVNAAQGGDYSHDAFFLTVHRYRSGMRVYSNSRDLDMTLILRRHAYYGTSATDSRFRMSVQLSRDGLSGTFSATHVSPMHGFQGEPINVRGSWSCASLRKSAA